MLRVLSEQCFANVVWVHGLVSLHYNLAGHFGMHRAKVFVRTEILERKRKTLVGIKCTRFELVVYAYDGVRYIVLINPCNPSAWRYFKLHGSVAEVIDGYCGRGRARLCLSSSDGVRS